MPRRTVFTLVAALVIGLGATGAAGGGLKVRLQTIVPNVVGMSDEQACKTLSGQNFGCFVDGPEDRRLLAGVASQEPPAGAEAEPGSIVKLLMAVRVPAVVGLDQAKACAELERARLICTPLEGVGRGPMGQVFAQDPAPRTVVPIGVPVTVTYVQGVAVPDVRDRAADGACEPIAAAGLVCRPEQRPSGRGPAKVTGQDPAPGTIVPPGTVVTLQFGPADVGTALPWWILVLVAAVVLVAGAVSLRQYRRRTPPGPPAVQVTLRPGPSQVRAGETREW